MSIFFFFLIGIGILRVGQCGSQFFGGEVRVNLEQQEDTVGNTLSRSINRTVLLGFFEESSTEKPNCLLISLLPNT